MSIIPDLKITFPKTRDALLAAFDNCSLRKQFIKVDIAEFASHLELAKLDLLGIIRDFEAEDWRWSIIRSYYAILHATNALLIKKLGYFSKDHYCAILALYKENCLSGELYARLGKIYEKFSDIFGFALLYEARKISQYDVVQWKLLTKEDAMLAKSFAEDFVAYAEVTCQ